MKHFLSIFVSMVLLVAGISARAETDAEVQARKNALDLAGAFANDGFKTRDGHWCGTIKPHDHALVAVNLYAGNQYWFSAGAAEPATKIAVSVYDESGKQVPTDTHSAGDKAAAGFSPANSGQYFVSVDSIEGPEGSLCLIYSYK
jgi:hypothetical protein